MYEKYSDDELIDAYSSMLDYSGEVSSEMSNAIELRGGLENFKKKIERRKFLTEEINRISKEIYSLTSSETNVEFIKKFITSTILTKDELDQLIESKFSQYQSINENREINSKTFIISLAGMLTACIIGAIILSLLIAFLTPVFLYFIVPIYIINYLIIKFVTKKTRSNLVIFIATLLATIGSIILGIYLAGTFLLPRT